MTTRWEYATLLATTVPSPEPGRTAEHFTLQLGSGYRQFPPSEEVGIGVMRVLDTLGAEGWELVAVETGQTSTGAGMPVAQVVVRRYVLKRPAADGVGTLEE